MKKILLKKNSSRKSSKISSNYFGIMNENGQNCTNENALETIIDNNKYLNF
jgi:hypothetical protein